MELYWLRFIKALRLQKWPVLSNAEHLLREQKKKLEKLYGKNYK